MRKLQLSMAEQLAQGHRASKCQSRDSNRDPGSSHNNAFIQGLPLPRKHTGGGQGPPPDLEPLTPRDTRLLSFPANDLEPKQFLHSYSQVFSQWPDTSF